MTGGPEVVPKLEEPKDRFQELRERKRQLIEEVVKLGKLIKYREVEIQALEELAKKADELKAEDVIRKLRRLEYRIATSALTARQERRYLKKIKELERQWQELKPYVSAKRRLKILKKNLEELRAKFQETEAELKKVREEFRKLLEKRKKEKRKREEVEEELMELEKVVEFEEE